MAISSTIVAKMDVHDASDGGFDGPTKKAGMAVLRLLSVKTVNFLTAYVLLLKFFCVR